MKATVLQEARPAASFPERTLVIIPAHNEEECVGRVVRRLYECGFHRIRVVSNGSVDHTAKRAAEAGAEVVSHPLSGYGLACWLGGRDLPAGVEWLLYCNADASDDLDALDRFAQLAPTYELILGSRTGREARGEMTLPQRLCNWVAPVLISLIWRHRFHDLGPQRAIRVEAYRRLKMRDRSYGWTVEMQVRAVEEGLRIAEIPVRSFPRAAGSPKISGTLRGTLRAGTVILRTIGVLAWRRTRARSSGDRVDEKPGVPSASHVLRERHKPIATTE